MYYDYERWYDPSIGRFISVDPGEGSLLDPQSLNPYVWCFNTPTSYIDPNGASPVYMASAPIAMIWEAVSASARMKVPFSSLVVSWNPGAQAGKFHTLVEAIDTNLEGRASVSWKLDAGPETATGYHEGWWDPTLGKSGRMYHPSAQYDPLRGSAMKGYSKLADAQGLLLVLAVGLTAWDIGSTAISDSQSGNGYGKTIRESEVQAAGWTGAYLGGGAGAAYGAELGLEAGPEGAVIGGAVGGLVGSIIGFTYGAQAVEDWGNPTASHGYNGPPPSNNLGICSAVYSSCGYNGNGSAL